LNQHCHHCKKRRARCAVCPVNSTHRYCINCVSRHFNFTFEKLILDPSKFWDMGCPRCVGTCPCAVCRNSASHSRKKILHLRHQKINITACERNTGSSAANARSRDYEKKQEEASIPPTVFPNLIENLTKSTVQKIQVVAPQPQPLTIPMETSLMPALLPDLGNSPILKSSSTAMNIICEACNKGDSEEKLLLCDLCDRGYHTFCLHPRVQHVPRGDWYCNRCSSSKGTTTTTTTTQEKPRKHTRATNKNVTQATK